MSTQTGDPKLRNSVKRRRGDNAGEHFAFFRGAFVVGKSAALPELLYLFGCSVRSQTAIAFIAPKLDF